MPPTRPAHAPSAERAKWRSCVWRRTTATSSRPRALLWHSRYATAQPAPEAGDRSSALACDGSHRHQTARSRCSLDSQHTCRHTHTRRRATRRRGTHRQPWPCHTPRRGLRGHRGVGVGDVYVRSLAVRACDDRYALGTRLCRLATLHALANTRADATPMKPKKAAARGADRWGRVHAAAAADSQRAQSRPAAGRHERRGRTRRVRRTPRARTPHGVHQRPHHDCGRTGGATRCTRRCAAGQRIMRLGEPPGYPVTCVADCRAICDGVGHCSWTATLPACPRRCDCRKLKNGFTTTEGANTRVQWVRTLRRLSFAAELGSAPRFNDCRSLS